MDEPITRISGYLTNETCARDLLAYLSTTFKDVRDMMIFESTDNNVTLFSIILDGKATRINLTGTDIFTNDYIGLIDNMRLVSNAFIAGWAIGKLSF